MGPVKPTMISKEQDKGIQDMQGRKVGEVLDYARNQQFYKAFKETKANEQASKKKNAWGGLSTKVAERITKI